MHFSKVLLEETKTDAAKSAALAGSLVAALAAEGLSTIARFARKNAEFCQHLILCLKCGEAALDLGNMCSRFENMTKSENNAVNQILINIVNTL